MPASDTECDIENGGGSGLECGLASFLACVVTFALLSCLTCASHLVWHVLLTCVPDIKCGMRSGVLRFVFFCHQPFHVFRFVLT